MQAAVFDQAIEQAWRIRQAVCLLNPAGAGGNYEHFAEYQMQTRRVER